MQKRGLLFVFGLALSIQLFADTTGGTQDVEKVEITLEVKNRPVVEVFREIERKTTFTFMYRKQDVIHLQPISISATRHTVASLLNFMLLNTNLHSNRWKTGC